MAAAGLVLAYQIHPCPTSGLGIAAIGGFRAIDLQRGCGHLSGAWPRYEGVI